MGYDAARNYRLQAAEFASPVGVIVQAYEQIIRALQEAARAADSGKFEHKTSETNRALTLVSHLEAMLDHEAGPKVANKLEVFYQTMRYQIVKASAQPSGDGLREVSNYFVPLRDAWRVVENEHPTLPGGATPAPRRRTLLPTDFPADQAPSNWSA
jgi:flagellar biosynthetic protein FliS